MAAIESPESGHTSVSRISIGGLVLAFALSAAVATAVGVAAWSIAIGGQPSSRHLAALQAAAYQRGVRAGEAHAAAKARAAGYGTATRAGFRKGYKKGLATGRVQGTRLGRSDGYRMGYAAGLSAGNRGPT
jgi:hypothetical protein